MHAASAQQLFQSDTSLATGRQRAEKAQRTAQGAEYGHPIWLGKQASRLPGEVAAEEPMININTSALASQAAGADGGLVKVITAHIPDRQESIVWTAESGRLARATDLESGQSRHQLRGHAAPVSALTSMQINKTTILFTASWDKSIRVWIQGANLRPEPIWTIHDAASDFIKALHIDLSHMCLISSGSDCVVRIWDVRRLHQALSQQLSRTFEAHTLHLDKDCVRMIGAVRAHTRPVLSLTSLPRCTPTMEISHDIYPGFCVFSGDSMGRILELHIELSSNRDAECSVIRELDGHETGVTNMVPVWQLASDDQHLTAFLWTCSQDQTVRRFPLGASQGRAVIPGRTSHIGTRLGSKPMLRADLCINVAHAVKSVLPLGLVDESFAEYVIIGMANGDIEVWCIDDQPNYLRTLEGHWHEVSFLGAFTRPSKEVWVASGSLDGTLRRWPLSYVIHGKSSGVDQQESALCSHSRLKTITAEEEAELDALLDED
ncbi:hypothetical protein MYAM1_003920 [Malassezia yamatoensis]|uniref:WD40 repeat-like protein n=1 Tax=Malassezia yamatoensis TaxID=253288 RepID=A0AAJ6CJU2_9BASI|nr:hypothetical protein MYAM1_003920 [Malassezia yamatoensis]